VITLPTFRGGLAAFNPISLAPSNWYSDTGADAAQWDDISGNGRHATQSNASFRPSIQTNALNGRQVRRFDGSNDILEITNRSFLRNKPGTTIFAVVNPDINTAGTRYVFTYQTSGNINMVAMAQVGSPSGLFYGVRRAQGDTADGTTFGAVPPATPTVLTVQLRWAAAQKEAWIGSTTTDLDASFQTAANSENADAGANAGIGGLASGSSLWDGDIAEIVIFDRSLATSDRLRVQYWLALKYNITAALP
jgi:hypothetical protein